MIRLLLISVFILALVTACGSSEPTQIDRQISVENVIRAGLLKRARADLGIVLTIKQIGCVSTGQKDHDTYTYTCSIETGDTDDDGVGQNFSAVATCDVEKCLWQVVA
jgi:hypothetical protein